MGATSALHNLALFLHEFRVLVGDVVGVFILFVCRHGSMLRLQPLNLMSFESADVEAHKHPLGSLLWALPSI